MGATVSFCLSMREDAPDAPPQMPWLLAVAPESTTGGVPVFAARLPMNPACPALLNSGMPVAELL